MQIRCFVDLSSVGGYFACLHLLAVVTDAAMNTCLQVSLWTRVFISLGRVSKTGIAGCDGDSVLSLLGNCQLLPEYLRRPPAGNESSGFSLPSQHPQLLSLTAAVRVGAEHPRGACCLAHFLLES